MSQRARRWHFRAPPASEPLSQYRRLIDSLTEFAIFSLSDRGHITSWNPGAELIFGYKREEVLGRNYSLLFTTEDAGAGRPTDELTRAIRFGRSAVEGWHVRKDGSRFWSTDTVQPSRNEEGLLRGFTKIVRDTTDVHSAAERLRESEERLRLLVESATDYAFLSIDLQGLITLWSSGAELVFGQAAGDVVGKHFSLIYTAEAIASGAPEAEVASATRDGYADDESWHVRSDGERFFASGHMTKLKPDVDGRPRGFVKIAQDVTLKREADAVIRRHAYFDELTGLPNRLSFCESVRSAIARAKREPSAGFAVIFVDLDRYKAVEDSLGQVLADELLVAVARILESGVTAEDIVARLGGDEFTILVTARYSPGDTERLAERIAGALREPIDLAGIEVFTSASIGLAAGSGAYDEPADVLHDARTAMYEAKRRGRDRCVAFDSAMRARAVNAMHLQMDLRRAIERDQFAVVYQPIVFLETRRVTGFEALVRWNHPERGLVAPSDFIPEAENIGVIIDIDRWVMNEACWQLARWQRRGAPAALTISVNLSSKHFAHEGLVPEIRRTLARHDVAPACLKLEITETALMENVQTAAAIASRISDLGVELYIDDFGTGYSSLSSLTRFPHKLLKVDRSFVAELTSAHASVEVARAVVQLAHNLGIGALAEGIETEAQYRKIKSLGCEYGQGYWFSRPLSAGSAEAVIDSILPNIACETELA